MEKEELNAILLSQTANFLWDYGTYLNSRHDDFFAMDLYYVNEKYFEIIYTKQPPKIIIKISEISLEDLIAKYEEGKLFEEIKNLKDNFQ